MTPARQILAEAARRGVILYRRGDRVRWRAATTPPADLLERLRAHRDELRALLAAEPVPDPAPAWRVVVDACAPVAGPVVVGPATITDAALCITRDLAGLQRAVLHRNAGRDTFFARLTEEYIARLRACGCRARVEVVQ
jgi:hypothetical protein